MMASGGADRASALLTDFSYCMARAECENGSGAHAMATDYEGVLAAVNVASRSHLSTWEAFFHTRAHILTRGDDIWPSHRILLQLAVEHADNSPVTKQAEAWLHRGHCDWLWLCNARRDVQVLPDACRTVFEGHKNSVHGTVVLPDGSILSWSYDNTLRVWDMTSGVCRVVLEGHTAAINGALVLANGCVLSWSDDKSLRVWDVATGACRIVLEGHSERVNRALMLSSGNILSLSLIHI